MDEQHYFSNRSMPRSLVHVAHWGTDCVVLPSGEFYDKTSIDSAVSLRQEEASHQLTAPKPSSSSFFFSRHSLVFFSYSSSTIVHLTYVLMYLFTAQLLPLSHHSILAVPPSISSSSSSAPPPTTTLKPVFQLAFLSPTQQLLSLSGPPFWSGRPASKLIVHSLAMASHNLTP